jgi:hypothetical protein
VVVGSGGLAFVGCYEGNFRLKGKVKCWLVMWLDSSVCPLVQGQVPKGQESKTTLVIQVLDLGFIMPVAFLSGILLHRRAPLGYLLASTVLIKSFTLRTAGRGFVEHRRNGGVPDPDPDWYWDDDRPAPQRLGCGDIAGGTCLNFY